MLRLVDRIGGVSRSGRKEIIKAGTLLIFVYKISSNSKRRVLEHQWFSGKM